MNEKVPVLEGWVVATAAADELGVARQSLNKMIHAGKVKSARRLEGSKQYVMRREELDDMKRTRQQKLVSFDKF